MNYDGTMESFINLCDDLQTPAEESIREMKRTFKDRQPEIEELLYQAKHAEGNKKMTLQCYEDALDMLEDLRDDIRGMKPSMFEKLGIGAGRVTVWVAEILMCVKIRNQMMEKMTLAYDKSDVLKAAGAGALFSLGTGLAGGMVDGQLSKYRRTREALIADLDSSIRVVKRAIRDTKRDLRE